MEKKKNIIEYQLVKILKTTDSTVTYLANKNFMSFKSLIRQIDLTKIKEQEKLLYENEIKANSLFNTRFILKINYMQLIGDWGLGIGDWGLGIGPNPQSPIPKPQSPIPKF